MEYISQSLIDKELEQEITKKLNERKDPLDSVDYDNIYHFVIERFADYLSFSSICYLDKKNEAIERLVFFNTKELKCKPLKNIKYYQDCLLVLGTKVYCSTLKAIIGNLEYYIPTDIEIDKRKSIVVYNSEVNIYPEFGQSEFLQKSYSYNGKLLEKKLEKEKKIILYRDYDYDLGVQNT